MPGPSVLLGKGVLVRMMMTKTTLMLHHPVFARLPLKGPPQRYAVIIRALLHSDEKNIMTLKAKVWSNSALALYFLLWNSNVLFVCFPVACLAGQVWSNCGRRGCSGTTFCSAPVPASPVEGRKLNLTITFAHYKTIIVIVIISILV